MKDIQQYKVKCLWARSLLLFTNTFLIQYDI